MTDEIASLFENAAPTATKDHREQVFAQVVARANGQVDPPARVTPQVRLTAVDRDPTFELEAIPAHVAALRVRRSARYLALAAAVVVLIGTAGIVAGRNRKESTINVQSNQKDVPTTAAPGTTLPLATSSSTSVASSTTATQTTVAVTVATTAAAVPETPTTVRRASSTTSTSTTVPNDGRTTIDATTVAKPAGTVIATFDGAAVGDLYTRLGRTPEGNVYYLGFSADQRTFAVQFFADATGPTARYELPASFLAKGANGTPLYSHWVVGPDRVLYGVRLAVAEGLPAEVVAVPTTGPSAGTAVARADATGSTGCWPSSTGITCGDPARVVLEWVAVDGDHTGQAFDSASWLRSPRAEVPNLYSAMLNGDAPISLGLPNGRTLELTNLRTWMVKAGHGEPLAVSVRIVRASAKETCVRVGVGWENTGSSFAVCIPAGTASTPAVTALGVAMSSLPGGSLEVTSENSVYTVEAAGKRFNLVRYDF